MDKQKAASTEWERKTRRTTVLLGYWTMAWVLSMALATFGPTFVWNGNKAATIAGIVVNLAIGFGMIVAHGRHLLSLDELHQKIQLQSMGLALGIAIVVGLAYSNLDVANVISSDAEIPHLVLLIGFAYMASMFFGYRRYR